MKAQDPKTFLWENISRLMGGAATVDAVHRKTALGRGTIQRIKEGNTSIGTNVLLELAHAFDVQPWQLLAPGGGVRESEATEDGQEKDLLIPQYDTGGSMGHGFNLVDHPPGMIKSWRVDHEWVRQNVPHHTGLRNLCIVTGFGPSMRPMFNPGDPLLVDRGVRVIDHEGVFFFRIGDEGFIKLVQRVPAFDSAEVNLRIISKNPDYPPFDISPKNPHFEVLAKVLTVWRSEQC